jgi:hypothetical protein
MSPVLALATPASRCAAGAASPSPACVGGGARPTRLAPPPSPLLHRRSTRAAAQVGEPSNKGRPASPTPGAPAPKGGSGGGGEAADAEKKAAVDAAAVEYAEGVARVAEEGVSSAGDVAYAARADAIAAERKVCFERKRGWRGAGAEINEGTATWLAGLHLTPSIHTLSLSLKNTTGRRNGRRRPVARRHPPPGRPAPVPATDPARLLLRRRGGRAAPGRVGGGTPDRVAEPGAGRGRHGRRPGHRGGVGGPAVRHQQWPDRAEQAGVLNGEWLCGRERERDGVCWRAATVGGERGLREKRCRERERKTFPVSSFCLFFVSRVARLPPPLYTHKTHSPTRPF